MRRNPCVQLRFACLYITIAINEHFCFRCSTFLFCKPPFVYPRSPPSLDFSFQWHNSLVVVYFHLYINKINDQESGEKPREREGVEWTAQQEEEYLQTVAIVTHRRNA